MKIIKYLITHLNRLLDFLISNINNFQLYIDRKFLNENKYGFEDLTPNIKETEIKKTHKTYLESIKWAVQNENIKNVALTGFYGTGKSTILNSFIKKNKGLKYLMISLSKFNDKDYDEQDVEVAILQQIFYSKKQAVLPDSRLKRIKNNKYLFLKAIVFFLWIISVIYILFPSLIETIIFKDDTLCDFIYKYIPNKNLITIPLIILFLVGLFIILKTVLKEILNLKLNKLSVQDLELIPKEDKDNLLNKNIDEIIYFFEKTKVEIVIIEDLDRFDNPSILIKLREINSLINNCEDIKNKVTFIYAIKDEMFSQDNNRAKFFDFLIPLIPIINYDNSYEILTEKLSNYKDVNDDFLKNISPYINDMRMLKNIVNEFKVYQNILNETKKIEVSALNNETTKIKIHLPFFNSIEVDSELVDVSTSNSENINQDTFDNQKLLSLVIYKNYYPKDFTLLQLQQGILYSIFNQKEDLHKNIVEKKEKEIEELNNEIKAINSEKITEIHTLRKLYLYELYKSINSKVGSNIKQILDEGITLKDDSLLKNENFDKLIKSQNIEFCEFENKLHWAGNKRTTSISFKEIETEVNKDLKYIQRENIIKDKLQNKIINLERKRQILQKNIKEIKYLDLSHSSSYTDISELKKYLDKIIVKNKLKKNEDNSQAIEYLDNEKLNEEINYGYSLLKTLLIEGYVDEHYIDYISYFYKGSLSVNDNDLKKKIIEQKVIPFDIEIDNVQRLVEKLAESNFKKHSILNHKILEYLLDGHSGEKLDIMVETISEEKYPIFEFIKSYLIYLESDNAKKEKIIPFIDIMLDRNYIFWEFLCKNNLDKKILDEVLANILKIGNKENLAKQNSNNVLTDYINSLDNFLEIFKGKIYEDELIESLKQLDIKFKVLNISVKRKSLFEKIYKNNLYDINSKMIFEILKFKNIFKPINDTKYTDEDIYSSNYTIILKSNIPELINYIDDNIKDYLENVFLKLDSNTNESEETIIKLLNNPSADITLALKVEIIQKQSNKISDIEDIEKYLWDDLIDDNKLQPIWKNVLLYFETIESFEYLENFLNIGENFTELSKSSIDDVTTTDEFIKALINSNISDDSFNYLVKSINKTFEDISILKVTNLNRLSTLINSTKVNLTNENIEYVYNKDIDDRKLYITLIKLNEELFSDTLNEFTLNEIIIYNLIVNSDLSKETISKIIKKFDAQIAEYKPEHLNDIAQYISKINLINISYEMYISLITYSSETTLKIKLLIQHFGTLGDKLIIDSLNIIGEPFSKIHMKQSFEIANNSENLELLNLLKGKYIKTIHKKKNDHLSVTYLP
jgi:hypothetical protein